MKVVVDINILLDAVLVREPHDRAAARFLSEVERGRIAGHLCAASVDTLFYLLAKASDHQQARTLTSTILQLLAVIPVDKHAIEAAFNLGWRDLEDAIIHESARLAGMEAVVTRDEDFRSAIPGSLVALHPSEAVALALSDPE